MPGVLPNAMAIDQNLNMPQKHDKLKALAIQHNGACTKSFRQGSDSRNKGLGYWYHQRFQNGVKWGGVCKALSVYWIAFHANDKDFWGWLFQDDGFARAQNANKICDLHGSYRNRGGVSKDAWIRNVLAKAGVIRRFGWHNGANVSVSGAANQVSGTGSHYLAGMMLANALAPNYRMGSAGYKQLSFHSPSGGGHAVAAWVAQDVAFFDPNYGEYWFEKVSDFRLWFGKFWTETSYGSKYTASYLIDNYGKKVNF